MTVGPFETAGTELGRAADDRVAQLLSEVARLEDELAALTPVPGTRMPTGASVVQPVPGHSSVPWARTYLGAGQAPDDFTRDSGTSRAVYNASVGVWLSFKDAPGTWLRPLCESITAEGLELIVTHNHEPENDGKAAAGIKAYHAAWDLTMALCDPLPKVRTATILMGSRKVSEWEQFWHPGVDLCGFDRYNPGIQTATAYVPPSSVFSSVIAFARAKGKPLAIGETGTNVVALDAKGRTQWAADARAHLEANGCAVALWWNQGKCVMDVATADAWLS